MTILSDTGSGEANASLQSERHTASAIADRAHDILRYEHQPLAPFFKPSSVAIVGATEKPHSVGRNPALESDQ
jgi:hypothetical protein